MLLAMDVFGLTMEQWTAVGAVAMAVQAVVLTVTLIAVWRQVREARRLREDQHRPFVSVDLDVGWLLYLSVRNVGHTMAHNVRLRIEPPLTSTRPRPWSWEESTLLIDGIPSLAPGRQYRWYLDPTEERLGSDLPMRYDVYLDYEDNRRRPVARNEHIVLDLNAFLGQEYPEKGLPDVVREIRKVGTELGKWTDGTRGLLVHAVDRQTMENRRYRPRRIAQFHETRARKGTASAVREWFDDWQDRSGWYRRDKVEERLQRRRRRRSR